MTDLLGDVVEMPVRKMAWLSDCKTFRYRLTRYWGPGAMLPFAGWSQPRDSFATPFN